METGARWRKALGRPDLNIARELGYDLSFTSPKVHLGIFPKFERTVLKDEGDIEVYRDERGITIRGLKNLASMPEFIDYPVKTPSDWEQLKAERLRPDNPARVEEDWDGFRGRLKTTGEAVQVGSFPYGVFGTPRDLLGVENLLTGFYDYPEMIHDMMQHLTSLWISVWERVAEEVRIDHIHIWEDMSGRQGSLISPQMVETFMMPCYDRIASFARAHGVRVISVDTDGECSELVRIMTRHGVNVFFPFEVQAGNDIRAYRKEYPDLGIMCGLDKRALSVSRAAIDEQVEIAAWMVKQGRYVPGFDHKIPPDVTWEQFRYAVDELRKVCHGRYSDRTTV